MALMTLSQARENFLAALDTLRTSKVRSFLTVTGIVIGVSSVISMDYYRGYAWVFLW